MLGDKQDGVTCAGEIHRRCSCPSLQPLFMKHVPFASTVLCCGDAAMHTDAVPALAKVTCSSGHSLSGQTYPCARKVLWSWDNEPVRLELDRLIVPFFCKFQKGLPWQGEMGKANLKTTDALSSKQSQKKYIWKLASITWVHGNFLQTALLNQKWPWILTLEKLAEVEDTCRMKSCRF